MLSKATALVLGILSFIPPFNGLLRFYLKQPVAGVIYTLTAGGIFIGNILDVVQVPDLVRKANMRIKRKELRSEHDLFGDESPQALPEGSTAARSVEQQILKTAKENGGCTTPTEVALAGGITIDQARQTLDVLVSKGYAELQITKNGIVLYCIPDILGSSEAEISEDL